MDTTQQKEHQDYWKYKSKLISFILVVDNFGVKYTNKNDIDYLLESIKAQHPLNTDWIGSKYIRIDLDWNY